MKQASKTAVLRLMSNRTTWVDYKYRRNYPHSKAFSKLERNAYGHSPSYYLELVQQLYNGMDFGLCRIENIRTGTENNPLWIR